MKLSILLLTILLIINVSPISGQPTPLDTTYRKVWLSGIGGVNSFLRSPIIGMTGEVEITDNKYINNSFQWVLLFGYGTTKSNERKANSKFNINITT